MKEVKVLVATPNYTNLYTAEAHKNHLECAVEWTKLGLNLEKAEDIAERLGFNWAVIGRTFVHFARTQMCQAAIDGGFTHIFWLDDDAIIAPSILPRFVDHDKEVVIAPYPMRRPPFEVGILSSTSYRCRKCNKRTLYSGDGAPILARQAQCAACGSTDMWRDFHNHRAYRNFTLADLDQGLIDVDGGGTHAMLVKTECLVEARGYAPPKPGEGLPAENYSYAPEMVEAMNEIHRLPESVRKVIDHYVGNLPDQSLTFKEEDDGGKPFFMMPQVGTEDMYWCYRAKCKGVGIYCDTDVFADHVGFAPVITKEFLKAMDRRKGGFIPVSDGNDKVLLVPAGVTARDHTGIRKDAVANLV